MRKFSALLMVGCLIIGVWASGAFAATDIKLAHVVNENNAFHVCALKFKELVEKGSGGELTVTIFPNAKLGDERNLLESMRMGVVDSAIITGGPIINFMPQFGVFDLPFLFSTPEQAYGVLDGEIGRKMLADMENFGWKGLAYGERGFRNLTNSKRPVNTPADMEGLKIRLMQNPVYVDSFKALGANAVPMAWTEALTALQQGTIEGQENPINVIHAFKLWESQKHVTMTRHAYAAALFTMSKQLFDKFPADIQKIVKDAAQEAAVHERAWVANNEARQMAELKERGMQIVEQPDLESFKAAVQSVYAKYPAYAEDFKKIREALAK